MKYTIIIFETAVFKGGKSGMRDESLPSLELAEEVLLRDFSSTLDVRIYKHADKDDPIKKGKLVRSYRQGKKVALPINRREHSKRKIDRLNSMVTTRGTGIDMFHLTVVGLIVVAAAGSYFVFMM